MTREELTALSHPELVALVIQKQETIAQLQVQLSELEKQSRLTRRALNESASFDSVSFASSVGSRKHHRHHRRHWYNRIWRSMFPDHLRKRTYVLIILIMVVLSLLAGAVISYQSNNRSSNNQSSQLIILNLSLA